MTESDKKKEASFKCYRFAGMALDPIHVGTGGTRLGRVDNAIVRDPVTQIPKIPGSSLAGVTRAYAAMSKEKYPKCAGQGGGTEKHCGKKECPVCTVFGFSAGIDSSGGFAGLAGFSDMNVLLFPVATQFGPRWITSPMTINQTGMADIGPLPKSKYYYPAAAEDKNKNQINLGWLYLPVEKENPDSDKLEKIKRLLSDLKVKNHIVENFGVVSDKLFAHIVNSNLEVRTSVAINPASGAAEEGALFTYEALPRATVLAWEVTCRNPNHFKINDKEITAVTSPEDVKTIVTNAWKYLKHLGIGGMGSRGMGRLEVLGLQDCNENAGNTNGGTND